MPKTTPGVAAVAPGPGSAPGERLAGAFAAVESYPVSIEARDRLVSAAAMGKVNEMVSAIQSDLGLAMAIVRAANRKPGKSGSVATVAQAVNVLTPTGVLSVAAGTPTYDPLEYSTVAEQINQRMRAHAMATQSAAYAICVELDEEDPGEALLAATLHDVGRLIVTRLHPEYKPVRYITNRTPEQRIKAERERYGIDHALAGGVLARRWDLPNRLAIAIERHHNEGAEGMSALVALADQVVHLRAGDAVSLERMTVLAGRIGLARDSLRKIVAGGSVPKPSAPQASGDPCPLSDRERDALAKLAQGKVYKQIAEELNLSISTVRTHLHNIYRKLEVVDRAQAVIKAREEGWV